MNVVYVALFGLWQYIFISNILEYFSTDDPNQDLTTDDEKLTIVALFWLSIFGEFFLWISIFILIGFVGVYRRFNGNNQDFNIF